MEYILGYVFNNSTVLLLLKIHIKSIVITSYTRLPQVRFLHTSICEKKNRAMFYNICNKNYASGKCLQNL